MLVLQLKVMLVLQLVIVLEVVLELKLVLVLELEIALELVVALVLVLVLELELSPALKGINTGAISDCNAKLWTISCPCTLSSTCY